MSQMDEREQQKHVERLIAAIDKTYHHPGFLMWRGFMVGLASGLGATIGVAIVLGMLGVFLRELGALPIIGEWIKNLSAGFKSF